MFNVNLFEVVSSINCETCCAALALFQSKLEIQEKSLDKCLLAWSLGVMGTGRVHGVVRGSRSGRQLLSELSDLLQQLPLLVVQPTSTTL